MLKDWKTVANPRAYFHQIHSDETNDNRKPYLFYWSLTELVCIETNMSQLTLMLLLWENMPYSKSCLILFVFCPYNFRLQ